MATSLYGSLGSEWDPSILQNPSQYSGLEQLAKWGPNMFGDQNLTDEQKLAYVQAKGLPVTYDPQAGWLVNTAVPQFREAYPVQDNSSLFDYGPLAMGAFLGAIGPLAGGALAGGAEAGATGATGSAEFATPSAVAGTTSTAPDYASLFGPSADLSNSAMAGTYGSIPVDTGFAGATNLTGAVAPFSQSVMDAFGSDGLLSAGAGDAAGATTASQWLSKLLGIPEGAVKAIGGVGGSLLGAYGANQSTNAYKDVANQYLGLGAPYRALLGQSYQPGFSMANEPGYKDALDQTTNAFLRQASAGKAPGVSGGNPMENPGAWGETLKYVTGNTALPALQNYRAGLAGAGQLGVAQSGPASLGGAQANGGLYDALGYGLNSLVNPQTDLATLLKQLGGTGNNIFQTR